MNTAREQAYKYVNSLEIDTTSEGKAALNAAYKFYNRKGG